MQARIPPPATEERIPAFDPANVLWFFGALATAFTSLGVASTVSTGSRGVWVFLVSLLFIAVYGALAIVLRRARWWIPGGLFAFVVVTLVPVAVVGFEKLVGATPSGSASTVVTTGTATVSGSVTESTYTSSGGGFSGSLFAIGLVTIVVGLIVYSLTRFEFVLAPVALATVVTALFFVPAVVDNPTGDDFGTTLVVTGALLVLVGLLLDSRSRRRTAFWWHVIGFGAMAYGYLALIGAGHGAAGWAAMLATAVVVLAAAAPLGRATWAVFGIAGGYAPLVHYVAEGGGRWQIPLILVFVSLSVMLLGFVARLYAGALADRIRSDLRA
ncbi:MAG TPA: hypothetical protein VLJ76_09240 [Gaiellaceae bacterium]|nr:hypothetical protein [Gaiellaceae bacterium]